MGFTPWPADLTDEGVAVARDYAQARGDIVAISFIGGIPWPEAVFKRRSGKPEQSAGARKETVLVDLAAQ
jgi:hypothetical protein